ncbi:MAG: ABC transporter permease [Ginsengibacter sp.]
MFKNYFKIAFRNLIQQKSLAVINIAGLSIGLACFMLFLLFAVNQLSFDRFHKKAANIYRAVEWYQGFPGREPGGEAYGGTPLGPAMKQDFADVENYVRIQAGFDDNLVKVNNKISRSRVSFADPQLFSVFSFKIIEGNANALKDQRKVILTRQKALQLFGKTNIVGQRIDIKLEDAFQPFIVGAVTEDVPLNSSIQFNILGNYQYLMSGKMGKESLNNWHMQIGSETYVQLDKKSKLVNEPVKLAQFRKKYYPDEEAQLIKDKKWNGKGPLPATFRLQALLDVHTNAKIEGMASTIDTKYIWILIAIAAGILIIACINFTTLSIGRSAGRSKEVGVRKVMGGKRSQLIWQFLTESIILSFLSGALALFLAKLVLPLFNDLSGVEMNLSFSQFPELIWLLIALVLLTGLLAGFYPALVLSAFKPVNVLKSKTRLGGANLFTKSLVTLQFVLSIVFIISTVIILQQVKYMRSQNPGFNKYNVVVVDAEGTDAEKLYPLFKQKLQSATSIGGITASEMGLGEGTGLMGTGFDYKGETKGVIMYPVDPNYLRVMDIKLIAGRDFDPLLSIDTVSSIIVNEALLRDFGFTLNNAVGQQLSEKNFGGKNTPRIIIGVAQNFNYGKLDKSIRPQMFYQPSSLSARKFFVRIKQGDPQKALAAINSSWKSLAPDLPFQYSFLDENFDRFYKMEERWSKIVGWAGSVSIFLACLGLFGLASLTAINRTKEIGIRKVLGASVSSIAALLSKNFLKLVVVALIIAIPLTWYLMSKWLEFYAYRINISWKVFAITSLSSLLIAFVTVSFQAIKAGIANPVKSLRTE